MEPETVALVAAIISLVSAAAAWTAVMVQRWNATDAIKAQVNIGARTSRAAVVSANRQKWIDAIRDDIAEFMATRAHLEALKSAGSYLTAGADALVTEERALTTKLRMLRIRIELRINRSEADHLSLLKALDRYDGDFGDDADADLRIQASKIFKFEWERLKKEAAGIDPFVKETKTKKLPLSHD